VTSEQDNGNGDCANSEALDFGTVYTRYHPTLLAFLVRRTFSYSLAEDMANQTFLQAWAAWGSWEDRGVPISAWLYRIALNLLAEHGRRMRLSVVPPPQGDLEALPEPRDDLARWEQATWVQEHLAALSTDQREALVLRFWEDRSIVEVATALGRSVGATKALLHRARRSLRARLQADRAATVPHRAVA
jgi:RNA polymerase sigma-70 factor (ECF subfamily)